MLIMQYNIDVDAVSYLTPYNDTWL